MPCKNGKIAKQQSKHNKIFLKQATKIFLRYEQSISVQGYGKQEDLKARYIASKQIYEETTECMMQLDLSALETAAMDICFTEMMNNKNKMLRTGANMLGCMISDWKILKSASVMLNKKVLSTDIDEDKAIVRCEARKANNAAIKADILVKEWAQQYKESDKNLKADWI